MSQDMVPETVTYKCSYCQGTMTSVLDKYRFSEICPHCRGVMLIPRPATDGGVPRASLDELNAPNSGEFPQANFDRRVAAGAGSPAGGGTALTPSAGLVFSNPDKIELPASLNEHAQHIERVSTATKESSLFEKPPVPQDIPAVQVGDVSPEHAPAHAPVPVKSVFVRKEVEPQKLSAFTSEKFKRSPAALDSAIALTETPLPTVSTPPAEAVAPSVSAAETTTPQATASEVQTEPKAPEVPAVEAPKIEIPAQDSAPVSAAPTTETTHAASLTELALTESKPAAEKVAATSDVVATGAVLNQVGSLIDSAKNESPTAVTLPVNASLEGIEKKMSENIEPTNEHKAPPETTSAETSAQSTTPPSVSAPSEPPVVDRIAVTEMAAPSIDVPPPVSTVGDVASVSDIVERKVDEVVDGGAIKREFQQTETLLAPTLIAGAGSVDAAALHSSNAEGMRHSIDPAWSGTPPVQEQPAPTTQKIEVPPTKVAPVVPLGMSTQSEPSYDSYPEDLPKQGGSGRVWLIAASLLIAACAGFFIYKTISDGQKRLADETQIAGSLKMAVEALQTNKDIDAAVTHVAVAKKVLANPQVPLTPEKVAEWNKSIGAVDELEKNSKKLDEVFTRAEEDPEGLKVLLTEKKNAEAKAQGSESAAYLFKIDKQLTSIEVIRRNNRHKKYTADLETADALFKAGKFGDAADKARGVINEMPRDPVVVDADMKKRAETFIERYDRFEKARKIRLAANEKNFGDTQKKLQDAIDSFDPKNEEYKPLIAAITALKKEVSDAEVAAVKAREEKERLAAIEKEKAARKLTPRDADMLTRLLSLLQKTDGKFQPGAADVDAVKFKYDGKDYRFGIEHAKPTLLNPRVSPKDEKLFIQCGGNSILVDIRHFLAPEKGASPTRPIRAMIHAMRLGDAMKAANVQGDGYWETKEEAPFVSGRRFDNKGNEYVFLGDRLYTGKAEEKTGEQKKAEAEFKLKAEALASAVEHDTPTTQEVRDMVAMAVRATATEADWYDHLPGEYVRHVIDEGYVENNMPGADKRLKKELEEFREGFKLISNPFLNFRGTHPDAEADELRTFEDHAVWRIYDKKSNTTTFAIKNPDDEKDCLFILYDYTGKLTEFPEKDQPVRVRMTHQAVGVTAEYTPATGKMTSDPAAWEMAAALELPVLPEDFRKEKGYGLPSWSLPPHVLLVDKMGNTKGIVTPFGRLDSKDFSKISDATEKKKQMEAFLDQIVKVLPHRPEGSYLHLYYRYMFQYILDSPVTDHQNLLGSRTHTGDIHQTTEQSLGRFMGGRYVGDCDDLAEFFMTLTRKMGKLSYVMSLPAHAACGWAEKAPNQSEYEFYILDTGPPRKFKNRELDKAVEMANRAYDTEGTMRFDPKSLGFLFRFNGEPTRTPYYLSSRMYTDAPYGEAMEKVQSYWHFHFYALGIQTMLEMIEKKGDRVPENCNEVAGLYGQVREVEKSIRWSEESIKQLKSDEKLSRMSEEFRIASMWRGEREDVKAYEAIKKTVDELNKLHSSPDSFNYLGMRMQVMGLLVSVDKPFEAWELIRPNIEVIGGYDIQSGKWQRIQGLKLEHMGSLTTTFLKMQDLIRNKKVLNSAESKQMQSLKKVLDAFYSNGKALFDEEDDFNEYMRKYAFVGIYYAGKTQDGRKKHLEQLLKDGPYPEPGKKRNHFNRKDVMEEDWNWIRLSISSYSIAIADAIDLEDPPEKWRIDEAVKLCDQMAKAGKVAEKFGSLGHAEFSLLSTRAFRAFLVKDWKDLEEVVKETGKRDWARLTTDISETFGRGARFCTPEEFAAQYRMFTKYIKSKPAYFTVVYEAYRADGFKHALEAAKIACELNPDDADMKRELGYLEGLVAERLKKEAAKEQPKAK